MAMLVAGALLATAAVLLMSQGAYANFLTGSGFPYENCYEDPMTSLYSAVLKSYTPVEGIGSEMCWTIFTKSRDQCYRENNFPYNKTHCCDRGFNKFKFFPNQACRPAVKSGTQQRLIDPEPRPRSWTYQTMNNGIWVMKLTPFNWTPEEAHLATVCITIGDPCPTLDLYAFDGKIIEFNLYDKKVRVKVLWTKPVPAVWCGHGAFLSCPPHLHLRLLHALQARKKR